MDDFRRGHMQTHASPFTERRRPARLKHRLRLRRLVRGRRLVEIRAHAACGQLSRRQPASGLLHIIHPHKSPDCRKSKTLTENKDGPEHEPHRVEVISDGLVLNRERGSRGGGGGHDEHRGSR